MSDDDAIAPPPTPPISRRRRADERRGRHVGERDDDVDEREPDES